MDAAEYISFAKKCTTVCSQAELKVINAHVFAGTNRGYFQTPNSFHINSMLENGKYTSLDSHDQRTVKTLKSVISRVSTDKDYLLHRFDNRDCLKSYYPEDLMALIQSGRANNKTIRLKKFFSTSMISTNNLFRFRPVEWRIKAPEGSHVFANGFVAESEALISEGSKVKILNITMNNGKILIEAELRR